MAFTSGVATDTTALTTAISSFLVGTCSWSLGLHFSGSDPKANNLEHYRDFTDSAGAFTASSMVIGMAFGNNVNTTDISPGTGTYLMLTPADFFGDLNGMIERTFYQQLGNVTAEQGTTHYLIVCAPIPASNISYWFFSDATGQNIVLVFQLTTGVFSYAGFGYVTADAGDRFGLPNGDGGQYCYASRQGNATYETGSLGSNHQGINCPPLPPGYMNADNSYPTAFMKLNVDGSGLSWWSSNDPAVSDQVRRTTNVIAGWQGNNTGQMGDKLNSTNGGGLLNTLHVWGRSRSSSSENIIAQPCLMSAYRTTTRWSPVCRLPLVRACVTQGVINEGAQFSIGSDTYRAFNSFAVQEID
jgi:hypothetical protein